MPIEFSDEVNENDVLQVAGDMALEAIRVKLGLAGIGEDDYSVVLCIKSGNDVGTVVHLPEVGPGEYERAVLQTQLDHATVTAYGMGLRLSTRLLRIRR